ncbi:MAG TPA: antitoxin Xre/MbcA/ParS toxin-binding domain-containing protein [Candidatus Nitrosotalea sp.]|nr:antitoxin Xre/MbcA/ParS toxin-binding domain-containing protein [Candidatus Nitrosotalea sp.]
MLVDARPLLDKLVASFGANGVARLIDVKPATISNWRKRKRQMDPEYARRVVDLHYLLARAFQTFQPETAMRWLVSTEPFLDAQRPIDVLVLQGPARVIAALDAHEAGAYP